MNTNSNANSPHLHPQASSAHPLSFKSAEEDVVLGQLLRILIDDIGWLMGMVVTVIAMAGLYCYFARPIYLADARVRVESSENVTQALTQTLAGAMGEHAHPSTDSEIEMIKSRSIVGPVVERYKLNFSVTPKQLALIGPVVARWAVPGEPARAWLGLSSYAWGGEIVDIEQIDVSPELENKALLMITKEGGAYTLFDQDGAMLMEGRVGALQTKNGVTLLVNRLIARAGTHFKIVRANDLDAITAFQSAFQVAEQGKQTGVIEISFEDKEPVHAAQITNALVQSYLHQHVESRQVEASSMLAFLKGEEPRLKMDLERAEQALTDYRLKAGSMNASDEAKVYLEGSIQYEQQVAAMRIELASLARRFGAAHPVMQTAQQQLSQLEAERTKFSERFRGLPAAEARSVALQRDAKVAETIYVLLLSRIQELSVQKAGTSGKVHLVDPALRPGIPVKPKKMLIMSAATMLGLIIGVGVVFMRHKLFKGIEDPELIERVFGLPLYGLVPLSVEQAQCDVLPAYELDSTRPILASTRPYDGCIESLRGVRTSLQLTLLHAKNGVVALTGPTSGDGKSFLSVNLAVLFADSGKRVLVIDSDMRRGKLEQYFGGVRESGLSELLSGKILLEEAIRATSIPWLDFIACGARPTNPSELLTSPRLALYLDQLAKRYDVIFIDTPPVLLVTDAALVAAHADTTLIVLRSGVLDQAEIAASLKRLAAAGVRVRGGIFNAMSARAYRYARAGYALAGEYLDK